MRRPLALLMITVGLTACGSSSASPAPATTAATPAKAPSCGPRAARTLASSGRGRAYVEKQVVFGCSAGHRRVFRLGRLSPCRLAACVERVRVAGEVVAYASVRRGVDTGSSDVLVRRLSDGKTLVDDPATQGALAPESFEAVASLVLRRDGAVAWIGSSASIVGRGAKRIEVFKHDRGARRQLLDSNPAIESASLRLAGSTISWIDGGTRRSARLS